MRPCGTSYSFEWTPMPRDTHGGSPCASSENAAHAGTSVPSTVAFSSAGGVPLELMAPAHRSTFLCAGGAAVLIFGTTCAYVTLA
ncbi:unnamed protein product [Staurois parvus]|uniref:Uncharacterized protein n=1 Tax=Staurois parvus TaxID=386267 RepID=A0ABN9CGS6_9NEOB|nr:unnamed protein product [Staurois parvus]